MNKKKMPIYVQIIIGVLVLVIAIFLAYGLFLNQTIKPYGISREQAVSIARKNADIPKITAYDIATTDVTTYSLLGENSQGQAIGVIIPKNDSQNVRTVTLSQGYSANKLMTKGVTSVVLGFYQDKPIWQVNSNTGFKIYDFQTGKELFQN
ncbi:MAG: DUF5590 domain-containing protein [Streptococcaceae bacterium]|nr:DUF5590 domain-containing protein [Streptococcaceae bacterium]MCL2681717.1 DUF5590 domain-containing protein [Streptococcaceae bacterium]MCL2858516.1 DUF5590 domain-containing protein [Streptococcaceae bacterium]